MSRKNGRLVACPICKTRTYFKKARLKRGARFCTKECFNKSKKGVVPKNIKIAQSNSPVGKKGYIAAKGDRHWAWQSENPSYRAVHAWIRSYYGVATKCENPKCIYPRKDKRGNLMLKPKAYQWANKSGKYERDIKDFIQLCASCHKQYDLGIIQP